MDYALKKSTQLVLDESKSYIQEKSEELVSRKAGEMWRKQISLQGKWKYEEGTRKCRGLFRSWNGINGR